MASEPRRRWLTHERRVLLLALALGLPALLVMVALLWTGDHRDKTRWTLLLITGLCWLLGAFALRARVMRPLQTMSNMVAALREGDFSIRARGATLDDALGLALYEVNALAETLREQRLGALETAALLERVMEEIDAAVIAFDADHRVRLANRAAGRLLGRTVEQLLGRRAGELGLAPCLEGPTPRLVELPFAGGGRWEARRSGFRQGGRPHVLLVLSDLARTLREEERAAWQRLVRVLGHEINNSLAPIKSIAGSLQSGLDRTPRPAEWEADLRHGLGIVAARAGALERFMSSYARLTRLPRPSPAPLEAGALVRRVAAIETRVPVAVRPGPAVRFEGDGDQLEQLLINLVRNAADAALETGGGVRMGWDADGRRLDVWVEDDGPGIADTQNLFVPFFTTKPHGSGIGLALSRQIAEAHGGRVTLDDRDGARGAIARLRLPLVAETTPIGGT
jgi:two-component system nitrogen regulation sensor histidine kinase NtrY